ncbi:hypothetical protein [Dyella terrae]|uniref:hypothetical protein n=1 Tax=Dyella terrae TaxID=522259 RepID=UPI001EFECD4F|nr:hypothetical protein [Dyella terrae]ULU23169.1 hypothetical protein DYST_00060 [Dyella terrae]
MNKEHMMLNSSDRIICVEVDPAAPPQLLSIGGETQRFGPYIARLELDVEVPSEAKLVAFLRHLVRIQHSPCDGLFGSAPGTIHGHIVVQDPSCDGKFPGGTYRVVMWIADDPSFHGVDDDGRAENAENAAYAFEMGAENVFFELDSGLSPCQDGILHRWVSTAVPECWLSYQKGIATVGWPIGLHAHFVGPDLFEVPMDGDIIKPKSSD